MIAIAVGRSRTSSSLTTLLRRLLRLARPYRSRLVAAAALTLLGVVASLALPLGLRELLDSALQRADRAYLNALSLTLLALFLTRAALGFVGGYLLRWTGERVVADLRARLYAHLHTLDMRFFASQRIGDLVSRLANDVGAVRTAATDALNSLVVQGVRLVGATTIMVMLNWRLSLMVLAAAPAASLASRLFAPRLRALARGVQDRAADTSTISQEALTAIRLVQAYARDIHEIGRYRVATERLFDTARRSLVVSSFFSSVVEALFVAAVVAVFWFGGVEMLLGRLTPGDLVAFLFYTQTVAQGVGELLQLYATFNSAAGSTERIFELLEVQPAVRDLPGARALPPVRGALRFDHVQFSYDDRPPALRDVTLSVEPGETVAIVGPNGAGKTTLLHLIPRLFDPTQGRVLVDGHDVRRVSLRSLREQVAFVSQDVHIFATSIRENIRYGRLDASDSEVEEAGRTAGLEDFVAGLARGYATELGEGGVQLSGGQRQRIAIARALLKDSRILLLDEAMAWVDAPAEAAIRDAVARLMRGRTTLIVSHRMAVAQDADRVLVLHEGRLVEAGTHEELLLSRGVYWSLVNSTLPESMAQPAFT